MSFNQTGFQYLMQGDLLNAFWGTMVAAWGMWAYVIVILITDVAIGLKSKSGTLVVIANLILLTAFQSFVHEVAQKIMLIATILVLTFVLYSVFDRLKQSDG